MQRYTMVFITVDALHVSGGFYAHHQELKNCIHSVGYMSSFFCFLPLSWVSWNCSINTRCSVYSFELLMMGGETAWNM